MSKVFQCWCTFLTEKKKIEHKWNMKIYTICFEFVYASCLSVMEQSFTSNAPCPIDPPIKEINWVANTTWKTIVII
jgi:hypothetical protein